MRRLSAGEQQLLDSSPQCTGCGHLDIFHWTYQENRDDDLQRCCVEGCTCKRSRCTVMAAPDTFYDASGKRLP